MENVGGIQFDVIADTGQLIKAQQETEAKVAQMTKSMRGLGASKTQVDQVSKSVEDLGKSAQKSGFQLNAFHKAIAGFATVGAISTIGDMADRYRNMEERVKGATSSTEEFELVQRRLIQSANDSFRPLSELQEVFIATNENLKDYGFTSSEVLDITDSMSFGFIRNAASSDKARSALNAYDATLSTGKVTAMQWLSISSAIDTLAVDMGKQMGKTAREIDELGFSGQLTAQILNESLLASLDENKKAAEGMTMTIADAYTNLATNISVYVGETNKAVGATDLVAKAINGVAQNVETLATLLLAVGSGALAKYVTSFGLVTVAKMRDAVATRESIASELMLAQVNLANAQAEVARTASLVAKSGAHYKNKLAIDAEAIAVANLDRAQKAMALTSRSFLSLLGGPAGIVGLLAVAGTSLAMFATSTKEADVEVKLLGKSISDLVDEFEKLNASQRASELVRAQAEQAQAVRKTKDEYQALFDLMLESVPRQKAMIGQGNLQREQLLRLSDAIKNAKETGEDLLPTLQKIASDWDIPQDVLNSWITQNGLVADAEVNLKKTTEAVDAFADSQNRLAKETDGANNALRQQAEIDATANKSLEQLAKSFQESANSAKDNGSAVARAKRQIAELKEGTDDFNQSLADEILLNAEIVDGMKRSKSEIKGNSQVLKDLQQELYFATLSGKDLVIAQAEARLQGFTTQQEIDDVRALAMAIYDLNLIKKMGDTREEQDDYFTKVDPLTGGEFDNQEERYQAELQKEIERYANLQVEFEVFRERKLRTEEEYNDLEFTMKQQHDARMNQIERASNSVRIKGYQDSANAIAGVLSASGKEQSGFYKAAFAVAKGAAIANATINAWDAVSKAWASAPFPANLGAVAMTTPQVMGVVSAIQGTNISGGRQYGGAVSAGSAYRINETGESEVFDAGGGKQYFIPNSSGNIIPANKVNYGNGQGGAPNVTINLIEDASRGGQVDQSFDDTNSYIDIFVANIRDGGEASQILESTYGFNRKGN